MGKALDEQESHFVRLCPSYLVQILRYEAGRAAFTPGVKRRFALQDERRPAFARMISAMLDVEHFRNHSATRQIGAGPPIGCGVKGTGTECRVLEQQCAKGRAAAAGAGDLQITTCRIIG